MRRMNSMLLGHQGASFRTICMYLRIASSVASSSQESGRCDDARRDLHVVDGGELALRGGHDLEQALERQHATVDVDVQRPYAGGEIDHARNPRGLEPGHERVDAKAQAEIEHGRPVLDEERVVAARAVGDLDAIRRGREGGEGPRSPGHPPLPATCRRRRPRSRLRRLHRRDLAFLGCEARRGLGERDEREPYRVARPQLTDLPELRRRDRQRADEAAEARTVGAEDDRHVAGEVERADRVAVVVDVRRVQTGFAAVARAQTGFGPTSRTPVRLLL